MLNNADSSQHLVIRCFRFDSKMLWAKAHCDPVTHSRSLQLRGYLGSKAQGRVPPIQLNLVMLTSNGANCTGKEVHLPNEIGHKGVIRIMVDLIRGPNLLNKSVPHNSQTVANSHGLFLIMGHKDRGHVGDFLNPPDFGPHM